MLQQDKDTESFDFQWVCQAISATEEPCKHSATCHCPVCGKWFCSAHSEDEAWHSCGVMLQEQSKEG